MFHIQSYTLTLHKAIQVMRNFLSRKIHAPKVCRLKYHSPQFALVFNVSYAFEAHHPSMCRCPFLRTIRSSSVHVPEKSASEITRSPPPKVVFCINNSDSSFVHWLDFIMIEDFFRFTWKRRHSWKAIQTPPTTVCQISTSSDSWNLQPPNLESLTIKIHFNSRIGRLFPNNFYRSAKPTECNSWPTSGPLINVGPWFVLLSTIKA